MPKPKRTSTASWWFIAEAIINGVMPSFRERSILLILEISVKSSSFSSGEGDSSPRFWAEKIVPFFVSPLVNATPLQSEIIPLIFTVSLELQGLNWLLILLFLDVDELFSTFSNNKDNKFEYPHLAAKKMAEVPSYNKKGLIQNRNSKFTLQKWHLFFKNQKLESNCWCMSEWAGLGTSKIFIVPKV